jgi:hypothetical protein
MVFILGFYNPSICSAEYAKAERLQDKGFHRGAIPSDCSEKGRPAP